MKHLGYLYIDTSKEARHSILAIILFLIVAFTGGKIAAINTLFMVLSAIGVFAFSNAFGNALFAGTIVYFGYSYIEFSNYISDAISVTSYTYILCALMIIKALIYKEKIFSKEVAIGIPILLFIAWHSFAIFKLSFITGIGTLFVFLFSAKLIKDIKTSKKETDYFIQSLILVILSTFVYVFLWKDLLSNDLAYGFCGARDGNNFSFLSNLSIVLVYFSNIKNKKILIAILSICVILTVSLSGFITLLLILYLMYVCSKKNKIGSRFVIGFVIVIILITLTSPLLSLLSASGGTIGNLANRVSEAINQFSVGDYQSATTNRTMLWEYYLAQFSGFSLSEKLCGSYQTLRLLQTTYYASHNILIDLLFYGGYVEMILFVSALISNIISHIKKAEIDRILFAIVLFINLLFRTMSGFSLLISILF